MPVLLWHFPEPRLCISSGPLGGGIGLRDWVLNATVPLDYDRTDPDRHLTEIGSALDLAGSGCGLLTAVDVTRHHLAADGGVHAAATVGLSSPAWAAAPDGHFRRESPSGDEYRVGTINIVVAVPVRLSDAALVNAVATATEAKAQALHETGGTRHRNRLGRDRRALPDGRHRRDLRRAALDVRCPDRASGARGRPRRRPTLELRAPRASLRTVNVGVADGIEALAHPGQRLVEDLHLFATPFVGRLGGTASTFGRHPGRTLAPQQAEVLFPRGPQPAL